MATDMSRQRQPAPKVQASGPSVAYDLVDQDQNKIKLPCRSPKGTLTVLRFVPPSFSNPEGKLVVGGGYAPVKPSVFGWNLVPRN